MRLLPVVFQHLGASRRQMRAVLLQARENHEIALVDELAAVTLDVAVAGRLFLRRAGRCCCWAKVPVDTVSDNRVSARRDLRIVILHFDGRNPLTPNSVSARPGRICWIAGAA